LTNIWQSQAVNNVVTNDSSSTHILIIALSLVAFILLALICSTLVYKIKMSKLKMRYRLSSMNGGPESYISTPGNNGSLEQCSNYIFDHFTKKNFLKDQFKKFGGP
jgi:hypothetical protein